MSAQDSESPIACGSITVVIPTYNRALFLKEAIDSVLAQTYGGCEVIVVDDGSSDRTPEVVADYRGQLRYVRQVRQGVSTARNTGIGYARGSLIAFLDSDDLWLPKKLERQIAFMNAHPAAVLCYTDEIWIRRGVRVNPRRKHAKHSGWIYRYCLPLCMVSPSSVLMRRELFEDVGRFDPSFPVCEDYDLWLRVAARYPIWLVPEQLIIKRGGHDDQLSRRSWGNDIYRVKALVRMLESGVLDSDLYRATVEELHRKCAILAHGFQKRGKHAEAERYTTVCVQYPL